MKAALCISCSDIVTPYRESDTTREWRWCQCDQVGVRWLDGPKGLLDVTSQHGPEYVRVLGFNNAYLAAGVHGYRMAQEWRELHQAAAQEVDPHYLFHVNRRNCWALIVAIGESGDVTLTPYAEAKTGTATPGDDEATP